MPRRPRKAGERPDQGVCRCGDRFSVAPKGPIPVACPTCSALTVRVELAIGVLQAALKDPHLRFSEPGRAASVCREVAERVEPVSARDALNESIERLEREEMSPEVAAVVARWLNAVRMRIVRRFP